MQERAVSDYRCRYRGEQISERIRDEPPGPNMRKYNRRVGSDGGTLQSLEEARDIFTTGSLRRVSNRARSSGGEHPGSLRVFFLIDGPTLQRDCYWKRIGNRTRGHRRDLNADVRPRVPRIGCTACIEVGGARAGSFATPGTRKHADAGGDAKTVVGARDAAGPRKTNAGASRGLSQQGEGAQTPPKKEIDARSGRQRRAATGNDLVQTRVLARAGGRGKEESGERLVKKKKRKKNTSVRRWPRASP
jgi:hypothetical protein